MISTYYYQAIISLLMQEQRIHLTSKIMNNHKRYK